MRKLKLGCAYGCGGLLGLIVLLFIVSLIIDLANPEGVRQRRIELEKARAKEAAEEAKKPKEPKPLKLIDPTAFDAERGKECGDGGKVTQTAYAVAEEGILRKLPQAGPPSVPFMSKGKAVPAPIDPSMTVRELCRKGNWSEVLIVTLPGHDLQGWVPSDKLRKVPSDASGRRVYLVQDIKWPKDVGPEKPAVVKLINRIMQQRPECQAMDTNKLTLIGRASRGTFTVRCFAGKDMKPFEFRAVDAVNMRSFAKVEPMDETDAVTECRIAAEKSAMHPSTVDFDMYYTYDDWGEGRTQVHTFFTAKNSFNLELRHEAICDFVGTTLENIGFKEAPAN